MRTKDLISQKYIMKFSFKELIVTALVYLTIDITYIKMNASIFKKYFSLIQGSPAKFKKNGVVMAYIILTLGLYYFIIKDKRSLMDAFFLGFLIYGVYDLTNYATLKKWTLKFSLKDTFWGGSVFALSTFIIYAVLKRI